jgi:hypothetical protein
MAPTQRTVLPGYFGDFQAETCSEFGAVYHPTQSSMKFDEIGQNWPTLANYDWDPDDELMMMLIYVDISLS